MIELSKVVDAESGDDEAKAQIETLLTRSASDATYQSLIAQLIASAEIKYPVAD